MSEYKYQLCK